MKRVILRMNKENKQYWWYSEVEGRFKGFGTSKEEVITKAINNNCGEHFYLNGINCIDIGVVTGRYTHIVNIDVEQILDYIHYWSIVETCTDANSEEIEEDYLQYVKWEDYVELQDKLDKVFRDWLHEKGYAPNFPLGKYVDTIYFFNGMQVPEEVIRLLERDAYKED